jgi:hypothetical protein
VIRAGIRPLNAESCDSHTLHALTWFFSRPWFRRLWVGLVPSWRLDLLIRHQVLQEVSAGADVLVHCGDVLVSWDYLGLFAAYFSTRRMEKWDNLFSIPEWRGVKAAATLIDWSCHDLDPLRLVFEATRFKHQIPATECLRSWECHVSKPHQIAQWLITGKQPSRCT